MGGHGPRSPLPWLRLWVLHNHTRCTNVIFSFFPNFIEHYIWAVWAAYSDIWVYTFEKYPLNFISVHILWSIFKKITIFSSGRFRGVQGVRIPLLLLTFKHFGIIFSKREQNWPIYAINCQTFSQDPLTNFLDPPLFSHTMLHAEWLNKCIIKNHYQTTPCMMKHKIYNFFFKILWEFRQFYQRRNGIFVTIFIYLFI